MKVELRFHEQQDPKAAQLVLIAENQEESKKLDRVFGEAVDSDGLIGKAEVECRLADGFREHYLLVRLKKHEG